MQSSFLKCIDFRQCIDGNQLNTVINVTEINKNIILINNRIALF